MGVCTVVKKLDDMNDTMDEFEDEEKPDKIVTITRKDGKQVKVGIIYGEEDYREVIARIIRNHYMD